MALSIKKSETEEVIRQAKINLVATLEGKRTDYFGGLKRLSKTYVEREVQECLEKTVNEVNAPLFSFPQEEVLVFTHFTPDDNCFSVTLELETGKGEARPLSVPCKKTEEFPHTISLYAREPLSATGGYRMFLCDIVQELILTARSWIKERLFELLKDLSLANKLYGVFSEEEKNDVDELCFVLVYPDKEDEVKATLYLINPLAVEKVYEKLKETFSESKNPVALLIDLARTPIPYKDSFARHAEGKEEPEKVKIEQAAGYREEKKQHFKSEKVIMGDFAYAYEICEAEGGYRLFAEYPGHRKDITEIIIRKKPVLQQAYREFLDYEKNKKKAEGERHYGTTSKVTHINKARKPEKIISPEVSEEISFIVDKIRSFPSVGQRVHYIASKFDSLVKNNHHARVFRRRFFILSRIFSFLIPMPEELEKAKQYRESQEDRIIRLIEDIKRIMAESGLDLTSQESKKVTAEIRAAIDKSNILRTLRELDELVETEEEAVQPDIESEPELVAEIEEEEEWPEFLPPLPEPGSGYRVYMKHTDAYQFLKESIWSQYLKHFNLNLEKDYLTQRDLTKRDLNLKNALWAQRVRIEKEYNGVKIPEIVPATETWKRKARVSKVPGKTRKKIDYKKVIGMTLEELRNIEEFTRIQRRLLKESRLEANTEP